jgi:hypothetical protein
MEKEGVVVDTRAYSGIWLEGSVVNEVRFLNNVSRKRSEPRTTKARRFIFF